MSMLARSVSMLAVALGLGVAPLAAQQPVNRNFQWYVGGQGGILRYNSVPGSAAQTMATGGAHMLITARRTGLLLSVDQAFGDNEATSGISQTNFDSTGAFVSSELIPVTFNYLRRYSAMLMAFPMRGPIAPYFGIGAGIQHTGGYTSTSEDARELARTIGSSGFGSLLGGIEIKASRFVAFGQYQVTTGPNEGNADRNFTDGSVQLNRGKFWHDATHSFTAGLRVSLGSAREDESRD